MYIVRMLWRLLGTLSNNHLLMIGLGGALGSICRYQLGRLLPQLTPVEEFPLGTFLVNILGSFLLGLCVGITAQGWPKALAGWIGFLSTGFCGGFTTFSTFQMETFQLLRSGRLVLALANVGGSLLAGLVSFGLGLALGMRLA